MGAPIITTQSTVMCGHGGVATHIPSQVRVRAAGSPVAVVADQHVVAGCPLVPPGPPPCLVLAWTVPALRVMAGGVPVLVQSSVPIGTGPGIVIAVQPRVLAT